MLLAFTHHTPSHGSGFVHAVSGALASIMSWPGRAIRHRQLMNQMAHMSDFELKDIGLSRQDVFDAGAVGFADDPSAVLAERAADRRRWSHH